MYGKRKSVEKKKEIVENDKVKKNKNSPIPINRHQSLIPLELKNLSLQ